ncbi:hypothetical protein GCM10027084_02790 [Pseudoxanthomonas sangjuensis]|uniref:DUF1203 domain-containing protein n=1 Tax=Pseudoxanthomonas sangjuensis TaxID=1503750 RepID=UPI0013919627|nr:DUF1203 domain-containing protein [Pseudoxanthomonas sangjuensis]KAF1713841.1 hypothetical protein CSC71_05535 [Pseudoxanthomonas sangjuensis]
MSFRITGLSPEPFRHLFGLGDEELKAHGAIRVVVDAANGYPERIELRDAAPGESVLLLNYTHQPADTPYRSSHAIYVREGAERAADFRDEVPEVLRRRVVALRAFDRHHLLIDADLASGDGIAALAERLFENPRAAYLHAHYAKYGCYAARVDRA